MKTHKIAASWDRVKVSLGATSQLEIESQPAGQPTNIESGNRAIESSNHRELERSAEEAVACKYMHQASGNKGFLGYHFLG